MAVTHQMQRGRMVEMIEQFDIFIDHASWHRFHQIVEQLQQFERMILQLHRPRFDPR